MLNGQSNSCIYEGVIRHRRRTKVKNSFKFSAFMFYLDLDEIDDAFQGGWFWSNRRLAYASFRRADHLKQFPPDRDLKKCVKEVLVAHGVDAEPGQVCLLTQLRYFGFRMNPISLFYCFGKTDGRLIAVIAEVNNTPWDQQHVYVIPDHENESSPADSTASERRTPPRPQRSIKTENLKKSFHVSPFMHSDMHYRMIYSLPAERIGVKMENFEAEKKIFDVSMLMHKKPITRLRLFWMGIKYPVYSLKVFAGIYFQALKLYLKKVPFHPHPDRQSPARN
jgi:DUF1365 family protein